MEGLNVYRLFLGGDNKQEGLRFTREDVAAVLTAHGIDGATLTRAHGLWKGKLEQTWVIELWGIDPITLPLLAVALRDTFHQETVAYETGGRIYLV